MERMAILINRILPLHIPFGKGKVISIWNPGKMPGIFSVSETFRDMRITVREKGSCKLLKVIKRGAI